MWPEVRRSVAVGREDNVKVSSKRDGERERERVINRTTVTITALYTCPNEHSVQSTETLHTE